MKLKLWLILLMCVGSIRAFAQTPKQIEADLGKSLDEIQKYNYSNFSTPEKSDPDSLDDANNQLEKKLIYYAEKHSSNINPALKDIGGLCSDDGLFDIFSWDTFSGGTQHEFQTIKLYRSNKTESFQIDTLSEAIAPNDYYTNSYDSLYTVTIDNKNYYLVTYYQILDLHARGEGIRIFSLDNGKLNKAKI